MFYEGVDVVPPDVVQRTAGPRVAQITLEMSPVYVDQSAVRAPDADVDASAVSVIDRD